MKYVSPPSSRRKKYTPQYNWYRKTRPQSATGIHETTFVSFSSLRVKSISLKTRKLYTYRKKSANRYPHRKLPSRDLLPVSAKSSASKNPIPVIIQAKKYCLSEKIFFSENRTTTRGNAREQSTAALGLSACREKVYHGAKWKPFPVSCPNNTAFCHSITPREGNTVQPSRKIWRNRTRWNKSHRSFKARAGANTVRKLGFTPVPTARRAVRINQFFAEIRSPYVFSSLK